MSKKNFLLLSLDDDKAKKVANTITNSSCKKILDYLAENEATETEISKKLKIPLPTVNYNIKQLMDAKLIEWDKYHYSEKGKEVKHYKIANKYIVITPKGEDSESIREKLKSIIPTFFVAILGGAFIYNFKQNILINTNTVSAKSHETVFESDTLESARTFDSIALDEGASNLSSQVITNSPNEAFWFILGSIFTLIVYILIIYIKNKFKKN